MGAYNNTWLADERVAGVMPFMLQDVATIASLNQADGIHPNRAGVDIMVRNVLPHVEALLPAK